MAKAARYSAKDLKNLGILRENSAEGLGFRRERCRGYMPTLQALTFIEGDDRTSRSIWNYATGTLTSWKRC